MPGLHSGVQRAYMILTTRKIEQRRMNWKFKGYTLPEDREDVTVDPSRIGLDQRNSAQKPRSHIGGYGVGGYPGFCAMVLLLALWFPTRGISEEAAAKPHQDGPRIYFPEPIYDFGTTIVDHVVNHTFVFTNVGNQVLELQEVKSTCGCTTAGEWSHRVEPGKGGVIPVEFHPGPHFNGPVVKPVMVSCNDTSRMGLTLQVKGIVWHPIDVVPSSAAFSGVLETPTNLFRTIRITNQEDQPLILSEPRSNQRAIAADIITNEPGRSYELTVRLVPPLGAGNVFGEISLKTSSTNMPTIAVPVWAIAQPAVMVLPPQLDLPPGPFTNKVTRSVSVRNNGSAPLELSDLALSITGVDAKLYELQKGQYFTVMLTFPEGFERAKGQPIELSFKSNNPKFPLLRVPIIPR
jgi:hypothetical protein